MDKKIKVTRSAMPPFEEYVEKIRPLWDTHWLTNMGCLHKEFEKEVCHFLDVPYASLMVNGHMALELVIQAMNFPAGGEVITTPFTFVSTTHAIVRNNLIPVFCDIKPDTYVMDESQIESLITDKTVAILPVHVYGNVCNVDVIQAIAQKYNLKVIYDACHAFAEMYQGKAIGSFGDASVFSFHATKVFNTIEGGVVTFSDKILYEKLYDLKNFGIRGEESILGVGANAKMNEFCAAMGLCNLPYVKDNIERRKEKVERYKKLLKECSVKNFSQYDDADIKYNYAYFTVEFWTEEDRNKAYALLRENDIYARKYFYPITCDAKCYEGRFEKAGVDTARSVSERILVLPLYPELEDENISRICRIIKKACQEESETEKE